MNKSYGILNIDDCYRELANAIVVGAANDLAESICKKKTCKIDTYTMWFYKKHVEIYLAGLDPEYIINMVRSECAKANYNFREYKNRHYTHRNIKKKGGSCGRTEQLITETE